MKLRLYILVLTMAAALLGCLEQQDRELDVLVDCDNDDLRVCMDEIANMGCA